MTETKRDARGLLDAVRRAHAGAYALATVVSLAARVEPALVRKARLELLPHLSAGDEADLWFGPLVQARSPLAIVFAPEVAELLRVELSKDQELLRRARQVVRVVHANSSQIVSLVEEEVTYLALSDEPDAPERIRALLLSAANVMVEGDGRGLAQWALRALPRLPERARDSEAAWALAVGAGARLGGRRILEGEAPGTMPQSILRWVLPGEHKQAEVGVRLLEEAVEFGEPPAEGAHRIRLPKTDPLLLEVSWTQGGEEGSTQVTLRPGQTLAFKTGPVSEINVNTPSGETFTIRREYELDVYVESLDASLEKRLAERLQAEVWNGRPLRVAAFRSESMPAQPGTKIQKATAGFSKAYRDIKSAENRRASRKVVEEVDEKTLRTLARRASNSTLAKRAGRKSRRARPPGRFGPSAYGVVEDDPRLIRVYRGTALPPELLEYVHVDFSDDARFEESYRRLLALVKDEPYAEPPKHAEPVEVYCIYSHKDEELLNRLKAHLSPLMRPGLIEVSYDPDLDVSSEWERETDDQMMSADIMLMLVSADSLASSYFYDVGMKRAIEMADAGGARVVPVILSPCDWIRTPLGRFQALPADGRPVTSWTNTEEAFRDVAEGIRKAAEEIAKEKEAKKARDASAKTRVYISHGVRQSYWTELLDELTAELQSTDFDIFLDRERMQPGNTWHQEFNGQIAQADAAVIFLSKSAFSSAWVRREVSVLSQRQRSDENFFVLTILLEGVGMKEATGLLRLDFQKTDFITAVGPPAATARQVVEALTRFRERKGREPSYTEQLEKLVADRLKDVPEKVLLREIDNGTSRAKSKASPPSRAPGPPADVLARRIVRGGLYGLAEELRSLAPYLRPPEMGEILDLVAQTWVDPEAAAAVRRVATGPPGRRVLYVNCKHHLTAQMYVGRAGEKWPSWEAVEVYEGFAKDEAESLRAQVREALIVKLQLDAHLSDAELERELALMDRVGEPPFAVFPEPSPPPALLETLTGVFPTLTLFLMGAEGTSESEMLQGFAEVIRPALAPGEEERALEAYESARYYIKRHEM